ncbi:hypothetical protein HYR99_34590 [Candidatus Poribacteria bacterium]|nr:hypothetical protein [Candidatus Poribacteria bacterium]
MGRRCFPDTGERCWVEVTFVGPPDTRGRVRRLTKRLIADLGCPAELVLDEKPLRQVMLREAEDKPSNFGWLSGYVVRVVMPEVDFDRQVRAYANRQVVQIARAEGFDGGETVSFSLPL